MGSSKVIHALYTDDDVLIAAVKAVKDTKSIISKRYLRLFQSTDWTKRWD